MIVFPQEGFQKDFLNSQADIVIGGGKAGAGKTFALLLDAARNVMNPFFVGQIFRRTTPQIKNKGALWDESLDLYGRMGATPLEYKLQWNFPAGSQLKFGHLEYESNVYDHQGAQYAFIGFDELTHFTEKMFFYLLSRNRSKYCRPYVRATCNPDPDSWVAEFLKWWIDQETGFPIPERDGVIRYFTRDGGVVVWGDSVDEVVKQVPHILEKLTPDMRIEHLVKSVTFIAGDIYDNKILLADNPEYLGNLLAQDEQEKLRLLEGNWKASQNEMALFEYKALEDIFTNKIDPDKHPNCVTGDVARFGSDLGVIIAWEGLKAKQCRIWTKCDLEKYTNEVDEARGVVNVGKRDCYIDVDGLGAGVVDFGKFSPFQNNASPIDPRQAKKDPNKKANYKNLKTQCFYILADKVNFSEISFEDCEFFVDGKPSQYIATKKGTMKIKELMRKELRAIRRKNPDRDQKKQINSKEEQKNILGGISPDFADTIMIRGLPLIKPRPRFAADSF